MNAQGITRVCGKNAFGAFWSTSVNLTTTELSVLHVLSSMKSASVYREKGFPEIKKPQTERRPGLDGFETTRRYKISLFLYPAHYTFSFLSGVSFRYGSISVCV